MESTESLKRKIDEVISDIMPSFGEMENEEQVDSFLAFQELGKREGLNFANTLIIEAEPFVLQLRQSLGDYNSIYQEYSNKFVDAAITFMLMQVNGNLLLSIANDINQYQKNDLKIKMPMQFP